MNIELKNVKYSKWGSQETPNFACDVWVNGKKAFSAFNDGQGGCTYFHPFNKNDNELLEQAEEYAKSLPELVNEEYDFTLPMSLELLVGELLETHLLKKEWKNASRKKVLFITDGMDQNKSYKYVPIGKGTRDGAIQYIKEKYKSAKLFNPVSCEWE